MVEKILSKSIRIEVQGPHRGQPILVSGQPVDRAKAAMLMVHGRGARAEDILSLAEALAQPGFTYFAPQAAGDAWYPERFMAPLENNEPWLSSALAFVDETFAHIVKAGIPPEKIILLGFSQGACLALEYAARHARRYGGLAGLSGGLIGPDGTPRDYGGSLAGTPVFLGCSEADFHIPKERVQLTAQVFRRMGAQVTERLYPNMGHEINEDEISFVQKMMQNLFS